MIMRIGKKEILLLLGSLLFALFMAESFLRIYGFQPGRHTSVYYFERVDSLFVKSGFVADSQGIFKIDPAAADTITARIQRGEPDYTVTESSNVYGLAEDNIALLKGQEETALSSRYSSLKRQEKRQDTLNRIQKAILQYVRDPVTNEGFRSIAFKQYGNNKPSVLLLGDSFTWGFSASNLYNSFADRLLAKGYTVYNTGITATDAAQYLAVARHYIPRLKPDYVIVNFYLGNDISYYKRQVKPYHPVFYPTNAGNLMACPHGEYFNSPRHAYEFLLNQWYIPRSRWRGKLMAQTVITTRFWKLLTENKLMDRAYPNSGYYERAGERKHQKPYSNHELARIKQVAQEHDARFILASIPVVDHSQKKTATDFPGVFGGLSYSEMKVDRTMYNLNNGHFNDKGHRIYAAFLDSLIQSKK